MGSEQPLTPDLLRVVLSRSADARDLVERTAQERLTLMATAEESP
jgi:hypothetical protein